MSFKMTPDVDARHFIDMSYRRAAFSFPSVAPSATSNETTEAGIRAMLDADIAWLRGITEKAWEQTKLVSQPPWDLTTSV
jgi:glycine cleavage system protein P-like pyridoxal-binding family